MGWNLKRSKDRVAANTFSDEDIEIADLSRTMDFSNLGIRQIRRVQAAHIYADLSNFHTATHKAGEDSAKMRKLVRAASTFRRISGELLAEADLEQIQFQAARVHALAFRPYADEKERALAAVKFGVTVATYLDVFNDVFAEVDDFAPSVGIAAGQCLIANIGAHGERELICLGTPANVAAKILGKQHSMTITGSVYDLLPEALQAAFAKKEDRHGQEIYEALDLRWTSQPDLAEELDISFNETRWQKRTEEARDALPLSEIEISDATAKIDVASLTERNSKKVSAVSLFADLDGFTRKVQEAEDDDTVLSLLRNLHMIRKEFHAVIQSDYDGVVLQHQGDRVFAILNLPAGEDSLGKRCENGLDIATAIQSSMTDVLKEHLGVLDIKVAVGASVGRVLVTRVGKKGQREVLCLGPSVTYAERLQLRSKGRETRISAKIYDNVTSATIRGSFSKDDRGDYVATGLTFAVIDAAEETKAASKGQLTAGASGPLIKVGRDHDRHVQGTNTKPWYSES